MENLISCPKCKAQIEDDSWYCDQCGSELMACPSGHGFGRGKMCGVCGTPLIPARQSASVQPAQPVRPARNVQIPSVTPSASKLKRLFAERRSGSVNNTNVAEAPLKPRVPQAEAQRLPEPGHIKCSQIGSIRISPGLHIGRENSPYAEYLLPYRQISRRHALFNKMGDQWTVTDLGSSCGTMVNRVPCTPNVPMPFKVGDVITFYDLDFFVSE